MEMAKYLCAGQQVAWPGALFAREKVDAGKIK